MPERGRRRILVAPSTADLSNERYGKTYNLLKSLRADDVVVDLWVNQVTTSLNAQNVRVHTSGSASRQGYLLRTFLESYRAIQAGEVEVYHHANLSYRWFNPVIAAGVANNVPVVVGPVQSGHMIPDDELAMKLEWLLGCTPPESVRKFLVSGAKILKRLLDIPRMAVFKRTLRNADRVVAVTEATKAEYAEFVPRERIEVIPLGVDHDYFSFVPYADREPARLVTVGRLTRRKGFEDLIDALPAVVKDIPGVHLDIYGDGPLRTELEARASAVGVADHVSIHGAVPQDTIRKALQGAAAFVHPSHSEGFSHARLEAMATGCPVVGTRVHAADELTRDGVDGVLVPVADSDALAEGVQTVLNDQSYATEMGRNAREHVESTFDWEQIGRQYLDLYRSLL